MTSKPALTVAEAVELSAAAGRRRTPETIHRLIRNGVLKAERDLTWPGRHRRYLIDPKSFERVVLARSDQFYIVPHPPPQRPKKTLTPPSS